MACRLRGRWSNICTRSTSAERLFATHYHELTVLAGRLGEVANVTMDVREWQRRDRLPAQGQAGCRRPFSYGIQVATLGGPAQGR